MTSSSADPSQPEPPVQLRNVVRFGVFEVDLRTAELRKQGVRIRLSGQSFQVLETLLLRPGELVTREGLKQKTLAFDSFGASNTAWTLPRTASAQAGIDLATLAAILGHNSIRIVQRYVHPTADHKQQAMRRFEESLEAINQKMIGQTGSMINWQ